MPQLLKENEVSYYLGERHIYPKVEGSGGDVNVIEGITMNETALIPDTNKVVDLGTVITAHQDISGKADKVPVVNHGTGSTTLAIDPNTFHVWGTVSALNITLTAPTDSSVVNLYSFQFTSGSTPTNLTLPSGVQWPKDNELTVEVDTVYEINIRDNKATWSGWEVV